jgi:elongation factor Ts
MTVPASKVKELRDLTGAGMMDAKRALVEADGDIDEARRLLRERGMAAASKREGRATTEGTVLTRVHDGARGAIVAVGCETEPVSANEEFVAFAERALDVVDEQGPDAVSELEEQRIELVAKLGENIEIRGAARLEALEGEVVVDYVHPPARKIGVLLRARTTPELARLLAMHISFASPQYLGREEIPAEEVEQERAIYEKLPDVVSKPENIRPQIVEGMLAKKFYAESVLLEQAWIHEPSLTVGRALDEQGAEILEYVRYSVAG